MYNSPEEFHSLGTGRLTWELALRKADSSKAPLEVLANRLWEVVQADSSYHGMSKTSNSKTNRNGVVESTKVCLLGQYC